MRAARVVQHGEPVDAVRVEEVDVPDVSPGTVRVRVSTASLNYGDIARARGGLASVMATPPFTLGMDVCGVVEEAGDGCEQWVGRRVVAMTKMSFGGMAEQASPWTPRSTTSQVSVGASAASAWATSIRTRAANCFQAG